MCRCESVCVCDSVRAVLTCATKPGPSTVAPLSSGPQLHERECVCCSCCMRESVCVLLHQCSPHLSNSPSLHNTLPLLLPPLHNTHPPSTLHLLTCSYRSSLCVPCAGKTWPPEYLSPCHPACVYLTLVPCKPRPLHRHH